MLEHLAIPRAELFRAMQDGALVLTGNARLSRSLRAEYDRAMLAAGREAWASPGLLPWPAWLRQAWEEAALRGAAELPRLLSAEQEAALWAAVLGRDGEMLLRPAATARAVARSFALLHEYRLDLDHAAFGFSEDSQAFRRWARRFESACAERGCLSAALLPGALAGLAAAGAVPAPPAVVLAGFYELSPAQSSLLEALGRNGAQIRRVSLSAAAAAPVRVQADDPGHELQLAARWARGVLQREPGARLGIVVPDLSAARAPLARCLADALAPAVLLPGAAGRARPWNFSLGEPLSAYPVIDTALNLLALAEKELALETVGALLASPWWAMPEAAGEHAAEGSRRALLDARLRDRHGAPRIAQRNLSFHAGQADGEGAPRPWAVPRIARVLRRLADLQGEAPARAGAAGWARFFSGWLEAAGWRRGSRLDSASFQAVEKWQELLATLSSLDDFEAPMRLGSALALIRRLAAETVFQPQAPEAQVPVQVLGLLEANEQHFDALWVAGLHDGRWPAPLHPDPFLPLSLQREAGAPGCDPERELERAREITGRLAAAAGAVVFSHPAADRDEPLRPSPLIRGWPESSAEAVAGQPDPGWRARARASAALETLAGPVPVPFAGGRARGGTQVLRHQAACPFRAFAEHRLGARPLPAPVLGLDAAERGSLMHKVLEIFWRETATGEALNALAPDALRARVEAAVASAIAERSRPLEWQPRLAAIERERLTRQALGWLALERQRPPFTARDLEYPAILAMGGFEIEAKIDRIDLLQDGRLLVIDYKTGKVSPSGWFGDRPDEPQLPVYTRAGLAQPVAGVVFGVVKADEQKFSGVVAEAGLLPGLPGQGGSEAARATETWPAVLDAWSAVCAGLASDFSAGRAAVDPKKGLRTCAESYCTLQPLCRVHTAAGAGARAPGGEEPE